MSTELFWLVLTIAMTGLLWVPYILDHHGPRPHGRDGQSEPERQAAVGLGARLLAAHTNAVENLVVFAPLVLTARALGIATGATAFACALYFWARLAHVVVYTLGIPVFRTLTFAVGFVAQVLFVLAIFKLI